jgi:hypothetical protein
MDDRATISPSLLVTRHLQRQSVAIFPKPTCIWRSDERDRNTGALHLVRTRDKSTDGRLIARRIAATGSKPYEAAFEKGMRHKVPALTPEEVRALAVFREVQHAEMRAADEGHGFAGGFGVPWYVDPTLIVTTLDQAEIGTAARIVTITTDRWHGVSTPGVSSGFTAENTVVADGSPTLAQPAIDVWSDKFYVPASLELTMDYPNWLGEITTLMMAQRASDVSQYCSIGKVPGNLWASLVGWRARRNPRRIA